MKTIISGIIVFATGLLAPQITQAQGTIYLSNLDQASTGSVAVGSDSWIAVLFRTGTGASEYMLNSIQLEMVDASGYPSSFTVMLYDSNIRDNIPGSSLGTLNGSLDPETGGIYTYTPVSNMTLFPDSYYYFVLTAGTAVANGAYEWSLASANSYNPSGGWSGGGGLRTSSNGSSWSRFVPDYPQYAINATAVPEPSSSWLLLLGSGIFIYVRRAFRR